MKFIAESHVKCTKEKRKNKKNWQKRMWHMRSGRWDHFGLPAHIDNYADPRRTDHRQIEQIERRNISRERINFIWGRIIQILFLIKCCSMGNCFRAAWSSIHSVLYRTWCVWHTTTTTLQTTLCTSWLTYWHNNHSSDTAEHIVFKLVPSRKHISREVAVEIIIFDSNRSTIDSLN